mmetsp:Transcript_24441/g.39700  ORF Transcript_24441/g.39700 Transcript_24441/m.39700 type:complete len:104 (+) Transcript_24441:2923-3234(+)
MNYYSKLSMSIVHFSIVLSLLGLGYTRLRKVFFLSASRTLFSLCLRTCSRTKLVLRLLVSTADWCTFFKLPAGGLNVFITCFELRARERRRNIAPEVDVSDFF